MSATNIEARYSVDVPNTGNDLVIRVEVVGTQMVLSLVDPNASLVQWSHTLQQIDASALGAAITGAVGV